MKSPLIIALAAAAATIVLPVASASAGDEVGPNASCQQLWVARNQIYKDAGFCFATARARNYFGNAGCSFTDQSDVPLSDGDRRYLKHLRKMEARRGC